MQRALDVSNYSGVFGSEVVAVWRAQGYDHIVCGTQVPSVTRAQLEAALAGGMSIAAYVYLYWSRDPVAQVRAAREAVAGYPVERLWLDCEDDAGGRTPEQVVALIAAASAACSGIACGIYTGRWWWVPSTGNSVAFSTLPLWHAEYTSSTGVLPDFAAFRPYGGWSRPAMWQFQGTTRLAGIDVDLNLREGIAATAASVLANDERWELEVLRAGRRFEQALHNGRYALRPVRERTNTVELVKVEGARWVAFEPPYLIAVD